MTERQRRDPIRSFSNRIPVSAYPLGDGFVIPVLYGTQSQWVRNVVATNRCELRTKGLDHELERPEMIGPRQALPAFPLWQRAMLRARKMQDFVWLHAAQPTQPGGNAPDHQE